MFYTALTQYLGFWKFGDEYKVMGLAAYGQPDFSRNSAASFAPTAPLSLQAGPGIFHPPGPGRGHDLARCEQDAGARPTVFRLSGERASARRARPTNLSSSATINLAASMQAAIEEVLVAHWRALAEKTKQKNLCLAGGVAFNCVANGNIFDKTPFEKVYVQPAAGDAGLAVGAAFAVQHQILRPAARIRDGPCRMGPRLQRGRNSRRASIGASDRAKT